MCLVCIELAKGKLNSMEARRALGEVALDPKQKDHVEEVLDALDEADYDALVNQAAKRVQIQPMKD